MTPLRGSPGQCPSISGRTRALWFPAVAAALAVAIGTPAAASDWPLAPNSRIRLTLQRGPKTVAHLVSTEPTALRVAIDSQTKTVPLSEIRKMEWYVGTRRNTVKGALIAAGAATALIIVQVAAGGAAESNVGRPEIVLPGVAGVASVGAGIGFLTKTDVWSTVTPPGAHDARFVPGVKRAVGVTLSF